MVLLGAVATAAYAWWATGLPPFGMASTLAVVSAGIVAMAFGCRTGGPPARVALARMDVAAWGIMLGALGGWQLAAYLQAPRHDHPTLSSLANALLDTHAARTLAFVAWLVGAARLARR